MKIKIKSWLDGRVCWEGEADMRHALEQAIQSNADLRDADLRDANLTGADLTGADLTNADLTDADLTDANLTGADLTGADLTDADLTDANLTGADLTGADLTSADLTSADLYGVRDDLWAVLSAQPSEVEGLRKAIAEGRINGATYHGECACLVGTLANICHKEIGDLSVLQPNPERPAERFFLMIRPGDTPEKSQAAKLVLEWVDLWLAKMRAAFASATV